MIPVGGLRLRLIRQSLFYVVSSSLGSLGWLDSNRQHLPVVLLSEQGSWDQEIKPNTVCLSDGPSMSSDGEMGSNFSSFKLSFFFDVYAESDAVGLHLATDIRDVLQGRFPSIGRSGPMLDCVNFSLATPTVFASLPMSADLDRMPKATKQYEEHWYVVGCTVDDEYGSELG